LEAMASGLPAIATRIAGSEELVMDGVTGKLVGAEDIESLRSALGELIVDESARREMGEAARERVEKEYSWESAASRYIETLNSSAAPVTQ
jgi:glycosyltransferase involved in cell wall biosynthesis